VTTSAQALNELLSFLSKNSQKNARFLTVAAEHLKIDGPFGEVDALKSIIGICIQIEADIENVPLEEKEKNQLRKYFSPFRGLINMSHAHLDINNAKSNFLNAEHLVGLMNIHMALSVHVQRPQMPAEYLKCAKDARALAEEVSNSELPERAKEILVRRLLQVSSAVENFGLMGSQALEESIETLLGSIVVYSEQAISKEEKGFLKRATGIAGKIVQGLKKSDEGLNSSIGLIEGSQQLLELLNK
jgi:hypothetical protein